MPHYMNILLQRSDANIPWGFRIRGENGNGLPLLVHRVTPGTIASNYLQPGDIITKLSNRPAHDLLHENIDEIIKAAGNSLELIILKRPPGSSTSPCSPSPGTPAVGTPKRLTPTSPLPSGPSQEPSSPRVATPTHTPPPPPSPRSFSPVVSPRTSMISPPGESSPPFPSPPLPLPPSPLTSPGASTGYSPPTPPPPPPPPPLPSADQITVPWRTKRTNPTERPYNVPSAPQGPPPPSNVHQYENLPPALQSSLLKDKKPFTYTPGGLDLSELRSPRMQRRIHYNQMDPPRNLARIPPPTQEQDVGSKIISQPPPETYPQPRVQLFPSTQPQPSTLRSQPGASVAPSFQQQQRQALQKPQENVQQNHHQQQQKQVEQPKLQEQQKSQQQNQAQNPIQETHQNKQQQQQQNQRSQQQKPQVEQQLQSPTFVPSTYNSPLNLYSYDSASEAYRNQTGHDSPAVQKTPVNKGTPRQRHPMEEETFTPYYKGQQPQSRSFRLLQVMTDTTSPDAEESVTSPKTPTRMEDDEMKFSGLRRNPIPSRAFQTLQRITGEENGHPSAHAPLSNAASESNAGAVDPELRYRGAYIPSRSFKLLQEMTGGSDGDVVSPRSTLPRVKKTAVINMQIGNGADRVVSSQNSNSISNLPPSEQKVEAEPKKYMGAYIPSRSFRMLQVMTGSDDSVDSVNDNPSPSVNHENAQNEPAPRMYMGGNIPSRSFRLLQAMTDPDRAGNTSFSK